MDLGLTALELARIQFAFTVSFHIIFPAISIGLASFLAVLEWRWLSLHWRVTWTGDKARPVIRATFITRPAAESHALCQQAGPLQPEPSLL